jgi:hypothetical protein
MKKSRHAKGILVLMQIMHEDYTVDEKYDFYMEHIEHNLKHLLTRIIEEEE